MFYFFSKTNNHGYMVLFSVIVIGAVGSLVALSLLFSAVSFSKDYLALKDGYSGEFLLESCAEEALQRIREDKQFTGSGSVLIGDVSCQFFVYDQGGNNRLVNAQVNLNRTELKMQVFVSKIKPSIILDDWKLVKNF